MKDESDFIQSALSFIVHPSAFILSINVREEIFEYMDLQPCAATRQCR